MADCQDGCPNDYTKISAGACGCDVSDADPDGDGIPACIDYCEVSGVNCDDGNICTVDSCNESGQCAHDSVSDSSATYGAGNQVAVQCPCYGPNPETGLPWTNHGEYVDCVAHLVNQLKSDCGIGNQLAGQLKSAAANAMCGVQSAE